MVHHVERQDGAPAVATSAGKASIRRLLANPAVRLTLVGWLVANVLVAVLARAELPLELPDAGTRTPGALLVDLNVGLLECLRAHGTGLRPHPPPAGARPGRPRARASGRAA